MPNVAARSRRAQGRVRRRTIRLIKRKEPLTHEHLVGELMMSQIDATLAVSHAIQELRDEIRISRGEPVEIMPRYWPSDKQVREMNERHDREWEKAQQDRSAFVYSDPQPPWWKEAEWFGWLLLLIFVIVVWFIIMYNFDSFVRWFGGEVSAYRVLI